MSQAMQNWINYLNQINRNFENINGILPEKIAFILYSVIVTVVSYFHEPWFDEAQAWMIARCATLNEILTVIPHYEGHPPLWHLLLMPIARSGLSYEVGLKSISIILCSIAMGLLIFKSPFPRILRLSIPFTYFFLYQYGVISRPYSLMMLGFMLAALFYKTRNEKPFRFIASMAIICGSSAYGIVLCAGISFVWLVEICWQRINSFGLLIKDKRIFALFLLLVVALFFIAFITPYENTFAVKLIVKNSLLVRLGYMLFIAPVDATCSYFYMCGLLSQKTLCSYDYFIGIFMGLILEAFVLFFAAGYKKIMLLVLPYILFSIFAANLYFNTHHLGIVACYLLFWFWIVLDDENTKFCMPAYINKIYNGSQGLRKLIRIPLFIVVACILMSLYWTVTASINEIKNNYGYGREMASFIKKNQLDKYNIIAAWSVLPEEATSYKVVDTNYIDGVELLPYFGKNIISNLNRGSNKYAYISHIAASNSINEENYKKWADNGAPDVIVGNVMNFNDIYGPKVKISDYILVKESKYSFIWKDYIVHDYMPLYVRKDIAAKLGLKQLKPNYYE